MNIGPWGQQMRSIWFASRDRICSGRRLLEAGVWVHKTAEVLGPFGTGVAVRDEVIESGSLTSGRGRFCCRSAAGAVDDGAA